MQAMIFAAGLGTRLKPITDTMPKAMVRVGEKPLIEHTIERLKNAGCNHVVVNVHHFAPQIIDFLHKKDFGIEVQISDESAQLLDTGGGIKRALPFFDLQMPVLIHNVDIFSNVDLRYFYLSASSTDEIDALLLVSNRHTKRYLIFNDDMLLAGWINVETGEVKSPFQELKTFVAQQAEETKINFAKAGYRLCAFSGIHILKSSALMALEIFPERFSIIDFYLRNIEKLRLKGFLKTDLELIDVGKHETLQCAEAWLKKSLTP